MTTPLSLEDRKAIMARVPWVTRRSLLVPCDGIKWGTVALRDLYNWGPNSKNPPRGIQERSRCKVRAEWYFVALDWFRTPNGWAKNGNLCWSHLIAMTYYSYEEDERMNAWLRENGFPDAGMPVGSDEK